MCERRCAKCDRLVQHHDEHKDFDCEKWPEWNIGTRELEYRGYTISRHEWMPYQYVHKDYDGPEDNRCGTEQSVVACFMEIDCAEDDL